MVFLRCPHFGGDDLKEFWKNYKRQYWLVRFKVALCLIPNLLLYGLYLAGQGADKVNDVMVKWALYDSRYGKSLWNEKAYSPEEV